MSTEWRPASQEAPVARSNDLRFFKLPLLERLKIRLAENRSAEKHGVWGSGSVAVSNDELEEIIKGLER